MQICKTATPTHIHTYKELSPGLFSLFCSSPSHFSDNLMLQQSASRSNISVPPLFYLGKFAALTMRHLFSFVSGQVTGSWQCYVLRALIHLSSPYPHTAIRRHLSQLEARLLLSQQTSLVRRRAASATRTQMMSSVIWALFKIQNNKMEASFPKSRFKWNAELKNTDHPIKSFTISSFNLSKL